MLKKYHSKVYFSHYDKVDFNKGTLSCYIKHNQICAICTSLYFNCFCIINCQFLIPYSFWLQTDELMRMNSVLLTWESKKGREFPTVVGSR